MLAGINESNRGFTGLSAIPVVKEIYLRVRCR